MDPRNPGKLNRLTNHAIAANSAASCERGHILLWCAGQCIPHLWYACVEATNLDGLKWLLAGAFLMRTKIMQLEWAKVGFGQGILVPDQRPLLVSDIYAPRRPL